MGVNKNWSKAEDEWLIKNYASLGFKECVRQHNIIFSETPRPPGGITHRVCRLGLKANPDVVRKNRSLANKNGLALPIGTIRRHQTGIGTTRLQIKIAPAKWVQYSKYFWEQNKGPLPIGYNIFFIDGNNENICLENMVAIPMKCLGELVNRNWITKNRQFNLTAITWCELKATLKNEYRCIFGKDDIYVI